MVTELHLQGAELLTFAIVHNFAQSRVGVYKGNTIYLSRWTGWTENTCRKHLAALVAAGHLKEVRGREHNSPFCRYELADDFYEKHPLIFEVSPPKNCAFTPQKVSESTPQNLRGDLHSSKISNTDFIPPTPKAVAEYVRSRGFRDPEGFADMFVEICTNAGWKRANGKGEPIANWKNYIVSSWEQHHKNKTYPRAVRQTNVKQVTMDEFKDFLR